MGSLICELVGLLRDEQYQRCRLILHELSVEHPQLLPRVHGVLESEFLAFLETHKDVIPNEKRLKHQQHAHPFLLVNGGTKYVEGEEGLLQLLVEKTQLSRSEILAIAAFGGHRDILEHNKQLELAEETLQSKADTAAKQALYRARQLSGNKFVYLTFDVDGVALPKVEIELFHRVCPRTCENFIAFCQGKVPDISDEMRMLGYMDNVVHRVARGGWIQAGDVAGGGQGDGACRSLFGRSFADESFAISHDATGVVSMANTGPHTNGSQFFITLAPLPYLDRSKVAFGRVVSGLHAILTIGNLETVLDRPCVPCKIVDCGLIES